MYDHELKCWPSAFESIVLGRKHHEVRKDDRNYKERDVLWLREWDPISKTYTGDELRVRVTHKTEGGDWGLPTGLCVMSIEKIEAAARGEAVKPKPHQGGVTSRRTSRDEAGVHSELCAAITWPGEHWCGPGAVCSASDGHDNSCARWEGFDKCDCSLSDDPYKERKTSAPAENTLHRGDKPVREGEMREGSLAGRSVPQPAPLPGCSFCDKTRKDVWRIIAGRDGSFICNECVRLSAEICEVPTSTFVCDHCGTVSAPHSSCLCKRNAEPDLCSLPAVGRRLAVHLKMGAIDEVVGAAFEAAEADGRWRVKLEKRGVASVEPGLCMVCPGSWGVE